MRRLPKLIEMRLYLLWHDQVVSQGKYYYGKELSFQPPFDKDLADGIGELAEVFARCYGYAYRVDIDMGAIFISTSGNDGANLLKVDAKTLSESEVRELYPVIMDFDSLVRDIEKFYRYYIGSYEISG